MISDYTRRRIVELYKRSYTMRQCAGEVGISVQTVHAIIRKDAPHIVRTPGRKVGRVKFGADHEKEMIALYKSGVSMQKIARRFGHGTTTVYNFLHEREPGLIRNSGARRKLVS